MPLSVELLSHTPEPERLVAAAAKLCYSNSTAKGLMEGLDEEKTARFLQMLMDLGHESPTEHIAFTFGIEGVSRSLLAQLTRHRIASYSVKSQRYVKEEMFEFISPPEIEAIPEAKAIYIKAMEQDAEQYNKLSDLLYARHFARLQAEGRDGDTAASMAEKMAIEDARYVLPNACETKLVVTMNARSLFNFFRHRCCERAQWEIMALADEMLRLVKIVAPSIFRLSGPSCVGGSCPEGKMTCGKSAEKRKQYTGN